MPAMAFWLAERPMRSDSPRGEASDELITFIPYQADAGIIFADFPQHTFDLLFRVSTGRLHVHPARAVPDPRLRDLTGSADSAYIICG